MNKQAAQTMPELPGPFDVIEQADRYNFVYTAAQMHQYARDYAAALSQTAGVTREWTPLDIQTFARAYKAEVPGAVLTVHGIDAGLHALAAAQAASGGEDDEDEAPTPTAMQIRYAEGYSDGVRDTERIAKERESSAASVSERARALMAQAYRDGGYPHAAGTLEAGVIDSVDSCALSALEQALTQQRGEVKAEPIVIEAVAAIQRNSDGDLFVDWLLEGGIHGLENGDVLMVSATDLTNDEGYGEVYTTPKPSADAVRELVKRWRISARVCGKTEYSDGAREAFSQCADELESLLTAASDHQQNAAQGGGEK